MVKILVLNVGSSSIKYSLFENKTELETEDIPNLHKNRDFKKAAKKIIKKFKKTKLDAVAHRVVHGGEIKKTSKITKEIKNKIKKYFEPAPLHNPQELLVIKTTEKLKVPQYAVFDTEFYKGLPKETKSYAIPKELSNKYGIQKHGFHGISHKSVIQNMKGKTISCHIGSGVSITASINGKPIETSMGFTPQEGVMMGTRSGSIDPGIIFFLQKKGYNVEKILSEKSGLKGISNYSDFRKVLKNLSNKNSKLAYEMFVNQISKTISSYLPILEGLDNLIFTASIGENNPKTRSDICKNLKFLGIKVDEKRNKSNKEIISLKNSKIKIYIKKTEEEKQIAEEVLKILK